MCIFASSNKPKHRVMKIEIAAKFSSRGTEINKVFFSDMEDALEEKGFNISEVFGMLADENEVVYVSNGFVAGLERSENEDGEWHHFFVKQPDGSFTAEKFKFN